MSVNALTGAMQSARDDLESLGYMFVYFLYGRLPWMGLSGNDEQEANYFKIYTMKRDISVDELCPDSAAVANFLDYARDLDFEEKPDYPYLIKLFENELKKHKLENDGIFDWTEVMGKTYLREAIEIDADA